MVATDRESLGGKADIIEYEDAARTDTGNGVVASSAIGGSYEEMPKG